MATTVVAFWNRLPAIAAYPLRGGALVTLAMLVVLQCLTLMPIIGFFVMLLLWFAAYRYAFEILCATAAGEEDPPEHVLSTGADVVWRFLGAMVVFALVLLAATLMGGALGLVIALVVLTLIQPGVIISLALDGDIGVALSPSTWGGLMTRIGWPYFLAVALLLAFQLIGSIAGGALAGVLPSFLGDMIAMLATAWGLFATFHLMGWLVLQYRDVLGYAATARAGGAPPAIRDRDAGLAEAVDARLADGDDAAAAELLREELRSRAVGPALHERYRRVLIRCGDTDTLCAHDREWLNQLMVEGDEARALTLLQDALTRDPAFVPMQREHADALLAAADRRQLTRVATDLRRALLRADPGDARAPMLAVTAASALLERFGDERQARELLDAYAPRVTDPALRAEVARLRGLLQAIGSA